MVYFITGMPLSGKSTLARRLAREEGLRYFSTGDFARKHGMGLEDSIKEMDLSVRLDHEITEAAMSAATSGGAVIDGFPRSLPQLQRLRGDMAPGSFVLVYVTENPLIIFDRIKSRSVVEDRPEDSTEVVAGRLQAALAWRKEMQSVLGQDLATVRSSDVMNVERVLDAIGATYGR